MEKTYLMVPLDRYEKLISLETRVNVVVERLMHDRVLNDEDILWILDTELSVELAQELYEKREKEREICLKRLLEEE